MHTQKAEIYDIRGKMLQQLFPLNTILDINIIDLMAGLYIVMVFTEKEVFNIKFIKE